MFAKLRALFRKEEQQVIHCVVHVEGAVITDLDELAKRLSASVLNGITKAVEKRAARPKVAVKKK